MKRNFNFNTKNKLMNIFLEISKYDQREYKQITLNNNILVTLIRDSTITRSTCALAIDTGASDDPLDYSGIAHFTEHMLFLGTEKYPQENYYKYFLSNHGGSSNASTSMEATIYHFDVNSNNFSEVLDIFSQFFKNPLFSIDSTSREIQAVDAEDAKNRQLDNRRILQILKCLVDPSHPYKKFSTGNIQTLAKGDLEKYSLEVREVMKSFYQKYYFTRTMGLALAGPQSIEELENYAIKYFSDIIHSRTTDFDTINDDCNPFTVGQVIYVNPVRDVNQFNILWIFPSTRKIYRNDPCRFIGFLLGHEGEGSIFNYLQTQGWATSLSAGTKTSFRDFSLFQISISLTPEGLNKKREIADIIHSYVNLVKQMSDDDMRKYWEEIRTCDEVSFLYQMKGSARDKVVTVADNTLRCLPEHVLSYYHIYDENLDPTLIRKFLSRINPNNEIWFVITKDLNWISSTDVPLSNGESPYFSENAQFGESANRREPWYGVHYYQEKIPDRLPIEIPNSLFLPTPNNFIPTYLLDPNYQKRVGSNNNPNPNSFYYNPPTKLYSSSSENDNNNNNENNENNNNNLVCYWSEDILFYQPRTAIQVLLKSNLSWSSNYHESSIYSLAERVFTQITSSKRYPATLAGLHQSVSWTHKGIEISCKGYTFHLPLLLHQTFEDVKSLNINEHITLFHNIKEKYIRALRSWTKDRPDEICERLLSYLLEDHQSLPTHKIDLANSITPNDVNIHLQKLLNNINSIVFYGHGDISQENCKSCFENFSQEVVFNNNDMKNNNNDNELKSEIFRRAHLLNPSTDQVFLFRSFNNADLNSALVCHFQAGDNFKSPKIDALRLMIHHILKEPLFTELRTKQQLGYVVSIFDDFSGRGKYSLGGLTVRVLSKKYHPIFIKNSLERFLNSQKEVFSNLTQFDIDKRAQSLCAIISDPPTTYNAEASRIWRRIVEDIPQDYTLQLMEEINRLTKEEVVQAVNEWIFNNSTRRAVFLMICSEQHIDTMKTDLENLNNNQTITHQNENENQNEEITVKFHQYSLLNNNTMNEENRTIQFSNLDDLTLVKSSLSYPS